METSRGRLLRAARTCLLKHGHGACSVKTIAAEAGVNHGLVHHYFGSKEGLWAEVVKGEAEGIRTSLAGHPGTFMEGFFGPQLLRHPERMRLAVEFLGLARALPQVREALREHFRINREVLRRHLGIEREATAVLVLAALFGLVVHGGLDPELPLEEAAQELLRLLPGPNGPAAGGAPPRVSAETKAEAKAEAKAEVDPAARSLGPGRPSGRQP